MARYVISVGGTGQHVALALTRLVRMGALRNDIRLIALDPDCKTELTAALTSPGGMSGDAHPLKAKPVFAPFDVTQVGEKPFSGLFVDPHHPREADLFEAMFNAGAASIPVAKGMFGTPCVGATVFAEGANSTLLQNILSPLAEAEEVYVCGSVVGGTGAGVMHKLIGEIRRYYRKGEMYGIFMLPWFQVKGGGGPGTINDALIARNAKHGIQYFYDHTITRLLDASILVGYPDGKQTKVLAPLSIGDDQRGENAHFLHLAAAYGFLSLKNAKTYQKDVRAFGIVHDEHQEGWILDEQWEQARSLRHVVRGHRALLSLLTFLTSAGERKQVYEFYSSGKLGRAFSSADSWGDLHVSIIENERDRSQQGKFVQQIFAAFDRLREEVKFCVEWVDRLFPNHISEYAADPLLDRLRAQKDIWPLLAEVWKGHAIKPNVNKSNTADEVARHHADLILNRGLLLEGTRA